MLRLIRDKLKTWAIVFLVVLIAIPLVFLGVGDYGTNQEQYAFKIDKQEVNRSIVLQEMRQFKDVLRKNYQGAIPPIYTDKFIKKITIDNSTYFLLDEKNRQNHSDLSENYSSEKCEQLSSNEIRELILSKPEDKFL